MSPTARALKDAREIGLTADKVEQRLPKLRNVTRDFIGCIDIIAYDDEKTIGIPATSGDNHRRRVAKAGAGRRLRGWLKPRHRWLKVWSYARRGGAGKRKLGPRRCERLYFEDIAVASGADGG